MSMPSDLEIARAARLKPITEIAHSMGIEANLLETYGEGVAKIKLAAIAELADRPKAKYVVVSAVTPTSLGEGKTTTTVGLGQAMQYIGQRATIAIRQPSMGPTFGIKGVCKMVGTFEITSIPTNAVKTKVVMYSIRALLTSHPNVTLGAHGLPSSTAYPRPYFP